MMGPFESMMELPEFREILDWLQKQENAAYKELRNNIRDGTTADQSRNVAFAAGLFSLIDTLNLFLKQRVESERKQLSPNKGVLNAMSDMRRNRSRG